MLKLRNFEIYADDDDAGAAFFDPEDPNGEHFGLFDREAEEWPGDSP